MKQLIIFLLVIILLLIGYSQYKQYKRFTPPEYEYTASGNIDLDYHDKGFLLDYYQSIESLNGYVISQWSNNDIDVRNPEDDDEETKAAMEAYSKKLGEVRYYESQLIKSGELKNQGLKNEDVKMIEEKGISAKDYKTNQKTKADKNLLLSMFKDENLKNNFRLGRKSALIFEVQKMLVKKGYDIPVDGVYKNVTMEALKQFEEKNNLFPDGQLDVLTFNKLLE